MGFAAVSAMTVWLTFLARSHFQAAGGGCKKLFRKIGNRSSEFYPDLNEVRRNGSYIYEEFVETQGTDVKMYTYVTKHLLLNDPTALTRFLLVHALEQCRARLWPCRSKKISGCRWQG
jgi:hypothetical protein